jgi:hypothetical protein
MFLNPVETQSSLPQDFNQNPDQTHSIDSLSAFLFFMAFLAVLALKQ